jgi:hypothetical protein
MTRPSLNSHTLLPHLPLQPLVYFVFIAPLQHACHLTQCVGFAKTNYLTQIHPAGAPSSLGKSFASTLAWEVCTRKNDELRCIARASLCLLHTIEFIMSHTHPTATLLTILYQLA